MVNVVYNTDVLFTLKSRSYVDLDLLGHGICKPIKDIEIYYPTLSKRPVSREN